MPLYFAYGSNMDEAALRTRCPKARALGVGRLARHRFVLMSSGYASVRRDPKTEVHGVLFELALSDVAPLDRYEEIDGGLYTKAVQPILRHGGASSRALIYLGTDQTSGRRRIPGYMEAIVAAARGAGLPPDYVAMLETFMPGPGSTTGFKAIRTTREGSMG
jgi:gamma-glutamylcyclotransferase (GGCT)/AIG2-like uncharacterized protein YtfP